MMHRAGLALLLSVSCAPAPRPAGPDTSTHATATAKAPAPPPGDPTEDEQAKLTAKLSEALAYVSEVRQLPAKSEVKGRLIRRDEIAHYINQQIDEQAPKDLIEATEALLYGFGTVDASFDYKKALIELMTSQLLGFYDPKRKAFFVGGDLSGAEADATLWHELVHALQDQHYDLSGLTDWQPDQGDRLAAIHGLAEGDATSAMLDALMKPRGATALDLPENMLRAESVLGAAALSAPPILVRSLLVPYVDGLVFVNELRRRGGFAQVDAAWRRPPASTEQLLHPAKYLAGEAPLVVALPPPPPHLPELKERFHDVMGEQTARLLLEEWLPAGTAAEAASDWGGDRLAVFSDDARRRWAVAWHLRFDTTAAAERALAAWARSAASTDRTANLAPGAIPPKATPAGGELCRARRTQGPFALVRRGQDLSVTLGPFDRNSVAVTLDPDCHTALAWARKVVTN